MTSLSDTLTVGLVLVLLFGSIALYLYTRIQQSEQKISLLESILLDIKMSSEIKSYDELPASTQGNTNQSEYTSFEESEVDWYPGTLVSDVQNTRTIGNKSPPNSPAPSVSSKTVDDNDTQTNDDMDVEQYKSVIADAVDNTIENIPNHTPFTAETIESLKISPNYESMTIKELQTLAKSRGITGAGSMKRKAIIEALKTSDRSQTYEPGSLGTSSFLETSGDFQSSAESE
jgi:hypothetical protein